MSNQVVIWFMETAQPIILNDVINSYTKGPLYCVMFKDKSVQKYPVDHIFSIFEGAPGYRYNPEEVSRA